MWQDAGGGARKTVRQDAGEATLWWDKTLVRQDAGEARWW